MWHEFEKCSRVYQKTLIVAAAPRRRQRAPQAETGLHLSAWRQRERLLRAAELLADGRAVTAVALELGYDNVSGCIRRFRRGFGMTPARYGAPAREQDKRLRRHRRGRACPRRRRACGPL